MNSNIIQVYTSGTVSSNYKSLPLELLASTNGLDRVAETSASAITRLMHTCRI